MGAAIGSASGTGGTFVGFAYVAAAPPLAMPMEIMNVCGGLRLVQVETMAVDGLPRDSGLDARIAAAFCRRLPLPEAGRVVVAGERNLERKWSMGRSGRLLGLHILPAALDLDLAQASTAEIACGLTILSRERASQQAQAALRAVDDIMLTRLPEPLRSVHRLGKALEILALVLSDPTSAPADMPAPCPDNERARLTEARNRLLADMAQPPSLRELAEAAGLTEKRLNDGFRELFGLTAFDLLRGARLDHAHQLIAEGGMPLKDVAWRVGYSHVSNFISAYRNRFGVTPGRQSRMRRSSAATGTGTPQVRRRTRRASTP